MKYLSLFSGIEAASVAFQPLGWEAVAFCENDTFPSAMLKHHYPDVPNLGDVRKADFDAVGPVDLIVFGSPCQSFSVAGRRLGLDDARGNLALLGGQVVYRKRPRWFIFENVPGLMSLDNGWDFGTLLAAFAGYAPGSVFEPPADGWRNSGVVQQAAPDAYGLAWRVLDAQFVRVDGLERAVPQRRRRLFIVGCLGNWQRAAAVLFERESVHGNHPPSRQPGKRVAPTVEARTDAGGAGWGTDFLVGGGMAEVAKSVPARPWPAIREDSDTLIPDVAWTLQERDYKGVDSDTKQGHLVVMDMPSVADPISAHEAKTYTHEGVNNFRLHNVVPQAFKASHYTRGKDGAPSDVASPLSADADKGDQDQLVLAFDITGTGPGMINAANPTDVHTSLRSRTPGISEGSTTTVIAFKTEEPESHGGAPSDATSPSANVANNAHPPAIAFTCKDHGADAQQNVAPTLRAMNEIDGNANAGGQVAVASNWAVRRLMPIECERLQGLGDNYTAIKYRGKPAADGPRYRAIGNSFPVNVVRWIGRRIQMVESLNK